MPIDESKENLDDLTLSVKEQVSDDQTAVNHDIRAVGTEQDAPLDGLVRAVVPRHNHSYSCTSNISHSEAEVPENGARISNPAEAPVTSFQSQDVEQSALARNQYELPPSSSNHPAWTADEINNNQSLNHEAVRSGSYGHQNAAVSDKGDKIPLSDGGAVVPAGVSGWSHQAVAPHKAEEKEDNREDEWQDMPAFAPYDLYDDNGKLIAREARDSDEEENVYTGLGGAGKGYTRVQIDEDAQSATSMDDNTSYLFKTRGTHMVDEDEEQRDLLAQMQATKDLLTEGQRIAYVGITRLSMALIIQDLEKVKFTKATKKEFRVVVESTKMWAQQMMLRLYAHMEISSSGNQLVLKFNIDHGF